MRSISKIILFVAVLLLIPSVLSACPTCKETMAGAGNNPNLVRGYGWSIMFMMSSPFLIFTGIGGYFYYEICKARKAIAANSNSQLDSAMPAV